MFGYFEAGEIGTHPYPYLQGRGALVVNTIRVGGFSLKACRKDGPILLGWAVCYTLFRKLRVDYSANYHQTSLVRAAGQVVHTWVKT